MSAFAELSEDIAAVVARTSPWLVAIHARRRIPSSGIFLRQGLILAANHTVQREHGILVDTESEAGVSAEIVGRDPTTDVILLRVPESHGVTPDVMAEETLAVGQMVLAIGRPGRHVSASLGMIAAVGDGFRTLHGGFVDRSIIADVAIRDGFSGGALVSARGLLVGMNNSALAHAAGATLPWSTLQRVSEQLLAHGHIKRGFLGVALQPVRLTPRARAAAGVTQTTGLLVARVDEDGPADRGGVVPGDIITRVGDKPATDPLELMSEIGQRATGSTVVLQLIRSGAILDLPLTIGERPRDRCQC